MDFYQLDVFAFAPYMGNPVAVFPDAAELSASQMQLIASEMHLSETTFVTSIAGDSYDVRIFTPDTELDFAGHPTIGTACCLSRLGLMSGEEVAQHSPVGRTVVSRRGDLWWFERHGRADADLDAKNEQSSIRLARALSLEVSQIGLEARELGRAGRLRPARSHAGVGHLMVPLRDLAALSRCSVRADLLSEIADIGAYCFTAVGAGLVRARGFFPSAGIAEDPATGSAAAELGIYLADRLDPIDFEVSQGREIGRPSVISVKANRGSVEVGGRCELVLSGRLEHLPEKEEGR